MTEEGMNVSIMIMENALDIVQENHIHGTVL
jgi:hypothetical protein